MVFGEDDTPGIFEFLNKTWITFQEFGLDYEGKYQTDWVFMKNMMLSIRCKDVCLVLFAGAFLTLLRYLLNLFIFKPFARCYNLREKDSEKFPEAAWKFCVYICSWSFTVYIVVLSGRHDFFHYPCHIWRGYEFNNNSYFEIPLPEDIYWLYIANMGYYLHSVVGTLFMDVWRKDSVMLLFHHFLTFFMLEFSFLIKYYRIGALVLLLHDISDILLEFTKINIYLKMRGNTLHRINAILSDVFFFIFTISWAWFRLYWYPLKLLHGANWCAYIYHKDRQPMMYLFFNVMLIFLQLLHIYWFWIIIRLVYKIISGQMEDGVEDTREYDVIEKTEKKTDVSKKQL